MLLITEQNNTARIITIVWIQVITYHKLLIQCQLFYLCDADYKLVFHEIMTIRTIFKILAR